MALPNSDNLDYVSWGLPTEYPINLETGPPADTGTLDYVSWGLPAAYVYRVAAVVAQQPPPTYPARNFARLKAAAALVAAMPFFFFQPTVAAAAFTDQPLVQVQQPQERPASRHYLANGFFFDSRPLVFTDQTQPQVFAPQPQVPSRGHVLAPYLFFDPRPLFFTDQTQPQTFVPPAPEPSRRHLGVSGFFFDPYPIPPAFAGQTHVPLDQPRAQVARLQYRYPAFFFDPRPLPTFTDQTEPQVYAPPPPIPSRRHLGVSGFFFDPYPIPTPFSDQVLSHETQRPLQVRNFSYSYPFFFAPVPPPGQAAETIYLPGWFQPTSLPQRNQTLQRIHREWLPAAVPTTFLQGDFFVESFIPFGVTRNLPSPGVPVYFEVTLKTSNPAYPAQARLYSITGSMVVSASTVSTTSTTAVRVRSGVLTLNPAAKEYRAEFGGQAGVGVTYTIYTADLIFGEVT